MTHQKIQHEGFSAHRTQQQQALLLPFCQQLPKCELHAHLNGCVRPATIRELAHSQHLSGISDAELERLVSTGHRTLADCFKLFDAVHQLTTRHEVITRITQEVVDDFAADGCVYLELRTTPKERPEHGISKRSYMAAVLAGLEAAMQANAKSSSSSSNDDGIDDGGDGGCGIIVKLVLSIDRRNDTSAALDTVELAHDLRGAGVVGIDLSGNPAVGCWQTWLPALQRARDLGLLVTLHAAEVLNTPETHAMLDFQPDRLCHMCMLDEELQQRLWAAAVPVELCLTSNVKTLSVPGYVDHHFRLFYEQQHPVVLCTDDSGIFGTTLSEEYCIAATTFGLSQEELVELALRAVDYCFCSDREKLQLRKRVQQFKAALSLAPV